jgi:hypothetical protein
MPVRGHIARMVQHPHRRQHACAPGVAPVRRYIVALFLIAPTAAFAKSHCSEQGALFFLGNTEDGAQSVWLSATKAGGPVGVSGYFRLDAAQSNQNVDSWEKIGRGLHLSVSPVVSNGNGGTHKLQGIGQEPCLLDSRNQKGGIIPPGGFHRLPKPPSGLMPTVPVVPEVPIGTLPPSGLMPTVPVVPEPPLVVVPDPAVLAAGSHPAAAMPCTDHRNDGIDHRAGHDCNPVEPVARESTEPYTPGRELIELSLWNAWVDVNYTQGRDDRNNFELESDAGTLTVGVDRLFDDGLAAIGIQASFNDSESESRSRDIVIEGNGINVGPYFSYRLSEQWSLLASLGLGGLDRDVKLLGISGAQEVSEYSGTLEFHGQYSFESTVLRPWGLLSVTRSKGDAFALKGSVSGQPVSVRMPGTQADYSRAEAGLEASWRHELRNGKLLVPYVEATARFSQVDAGNELQLGGDFESTVDDWSGTLRGGTRLLVGSATMLELGAGYQSLGQSDLDVWEFFFFVSHGF